MLHFKDQQMSKLKLAIKTRCDSEVMRGVNTVREQTDKAELI